MRFTRFVWYGTLGRGVFRRNRREHGHGHRGGVRRTPNSSLPCAPGTTSATGTLYERHAGAALVVARRYTDATATPTTSSPTPSRPFFLAIQRGNGPDVAFRAYLFTVVRRVATVQRTRARRTQPTDDVASLEAGTAWAGTAEEPVLEGFERGVVAAGLPRVARAVAGRAVAHRGRGPEARAGRARCLGLTANGVAALAYRAREGLRQAYLQQHLQRPARRGLPVRAGKLGAYVRGGLGTRDNAQVEQHLDGCGECRVLVLELADVNHGMRAIIAPLVLGVAGMGALAHFLPVGGGIAAGAALAAGQGQGAGLATTAVSGAGGVAGASAVAAGGAGGAAGVAAVAGGAGAAASAGAVGGVAAFLATVPPAAAASSRAPSRSSG